MKSFPHGFGSISRSSDLFTPSRGGRQRRIIQKFLAFSTRRSFHSLVRSNHIL